MALRCQPLREAVSWNGYFPGSCFHTCRQPLREAVSWNILAVLICECHFVSLFVRLWVEMNKATRGLIALPDVSLFVRLWVEIFLTRYQRERKSSASSWGCELKYVVGQLLDVLVLSQPLREAVSWNVNSFLLLCDFLCQPLREAVSWNATICKILVASSVSLFVRLWVEIKIKGLL